MKVLDLLCADGHVFEGWFANEDDFQSQLSGRLLVCPLCGEPEVRKMLSAPRLSLGAHAGEISQEKHPEHRQVLDKTEGAENHMVDPNVQATLLKALRHVVRHTADVGEKFAEEARRMHYGETERRNIRGQVSMQEAVELIEEGIDVLPLPMPEVLKETLQ